MILLADSGSTKTSWLCYHLSSKEKMTFTTLGINPIIHHQEDIIRIISENKDLIALGNQIKKIYFFGAGCSSNSRNEIAKNAMQTIFNQAEIQIDEDMVAAGISICGGEKGIACILGTGSNSILYDGQNWHNSNAGIGFILGDEGSGAYFGKLLLRDFLYQTMPNEIYQYIKDNYKLTKDDIFSKVYKMPSPNRYLASFAPVLSEFRENDYCQMMLQNGFTEFFDYHITCFDDYKNMPVGFVGSIAYIFQDEIKNVAKSFDVQLGKFIKEPIDGLLDYYINKNYI